MRCFWTRKPAKFSILSAGARDLENGIIRAIGDPEQRFREDYLRMLRAVRFAARLGFRIEPETAASDPDACASSSR